MNLNRSNMSHPRMQWGIEAAMWRAIELSRNEVGLGTAGVCTASGAKLFSVHHDRQAIPAFSFWQGGKDITAQVLRILRQQA